MRSTESAIHLPGIVRDHESRGTNRRITISVAAPEARYRPELHALGASFVSPRALVVAASIAVALYLIGRRLSE